MHSPLAAPVILRGDHIKERFFMQTGIQYSCNWKNKAALFLASQTVSMFGSSLVQYAITWYITLTTKSGVLMTVSILCWLLPNFIMAPFAGVWADRYSRKKLIALSDAMVALVTLAMAVLFLNGYNSLWLIFIGTALRAFGSGVQAPAVGAVLPQLVPQEKLTRINGINSSLQSAITLISPAISGALLAMAKIEYIFFIDVATAAAAITILLAFIDIPLHAKARQNEKSGYFKDMKSGLDYIKRSSFLIRLFIFYGIFFILIAPTAFLSQLQVTRSFGADVWRLTAVEIAFSAGMIIGGAAIASWGGFKNRVRTSVMAFLLFGGSTLALGLIPIFWIYLVFMGITGIALPFLNTPSTVLLQEKVEENHLGRVFGIWSMMSTSLMQAGMLIFGPVADYIKIEWIMIGTGALLLVLGVVLSRNKVLIRAGVKEA